MRDMVAPVSRIATNRIKDIASDRAILDGLELSAGAYVNQANHAHFFGKRPSDAGDIYIMFDCDMESGDVAITSGFTYTVEGDILGMSAKEAQEIARP